jgi:hypothetical protein
VARAKGNSHEPTSIVRHPVTDDAAWRATYDSAAVTALHAKYDVTDTEVLRSPDDANDVVVVIHRLPSDWFVEHLIRHPRSRST